MIYNADTLRCAMETCRFCHDEIPDELIEDCAERDGLPCSPIVEQSDLRWEICPRCKGDGTLGGWAGDFTESDRAEWDYDDYEAYREHRRICEDCEGAGKVRGCEATPELDQLDREYWESYAIEQQERRMGA